MFYTIVRGVVFLLARIFCRLKVVGEGHVPSHGGVIVAANHNSYFDIPLLASALSRPVDHIAKIELFRNPLIGFLFRNLGGFPVRRGRVDRSALNESLKRLLGGRALMVYPEGTRSPDGALLPPKLGIGWLVAHSQVSVVPAYIQGTNPVRFFHPVVIVFGKPLNYAEKIKAAEDGGIHTKMLYATIARDVMANVQRLRDGAS